MKAKILTIILTVSMLFTSLTVLNSVSVCAAEEEPETVYTISGNVEELFGAVWSEEIADCNTMKQDGTLYTFTIKDVQPQYGPNRNGIRFKVLKHLPSGRIYSYGDRDSVGYIYNDNSFRICKTCDVTITFDTETHEIDILGDGVRRNDVDYSRFYAYSMNCDAFGEYSYSDPYPLNNEMVCGDDGVYSVTFKDVQPRENILINVNEDTNLAIVGSTGYNYCGIDVTKPCDVTVYFKGYSYGDSAKIWAEGDGVVIRTKPLIGSMHCVMSSDYYKPSEENKATQVDDYVFTYRADNLDGGKEYGFQFYNVQENHNDVWYGSTYGKYSEFGEPAKALSSLSSYGAMFQKAGLVAPYDNASVLITLDLTDFDYYTKEGATITVDLIEFVGDVNDDGIINIVDATTLQKYLAETLTLNDKQLKLADANGDGKIDITDVTQIQKMLAEQ